MLTLCVGSKSNVTLSLPSKELIQGCHFTYGRHGQATGQRIVCIQMLGTKVNERVMVDDIRLVT